MSINSNEGNDFATDIMEVLKSDKKNDRCGCSLHYRYGSRLWRIIYTTALIMLRAGTPMTARLIIIVKETGEKGAWPIR